MSESRIDTISAYDRDAAALSALYEQVSSDALLGPHTDLLEGAVGRLALDVGAGSGRDGAYLSGRGYEVVAVEPAAGMRAAGARLHPELRWVDDRLPDLSAVHRLGLSFDLILLSAVWMHVSPGDRPRAFRKLATLLKPGGLMILTLRHGPSPPDRPMHAVSPGEIEHLARDHGLVVARAIERPDQQGREAVTWTHVCLTVPDDGSASLPLIRSVILNDDKSSTYKLGLLRAVAKVADAAPSLAQPVPGGEDVVSIPMGMIALNWLRLYLPLVKAGFPQAPGNAGPDGLGFAKEGFRQLVADNVVAQDLRIGAAFSTGRAQALVSALSEARRTLVAMPMRFLTYPNSQTPVFRAEGRTTRISGGFVIDQAFLGQWGQVLVPGPLWRTMQRLGSWIDPVLVAEWARLTRGYALRAGADLAPGSLEAAMTWQDPIRDVSLARARAADLEAGGAPLRCIWSQAKLSLATLDIDHALPWSAWPCGDLWNLFPSARRLNQHEKRERLPSGAALAQARTPMLAWWDEAWSSSPVLAQRFEAEARATLPIDGAVSTEAVFAGMEWRRLRVEQDQLAPIWAGPTERKV